MYDIKKPVFTNFICPECDAENPYEDGFQEKDEIMCFYCGITYEVKVVGEGRIKLKNCS